MSARVHHLLDEMLALEHSERSALLLALLDSLEDDEPSDEVHEASPLWIGVRPLPFLGKRQRLDF
jgi:hypothetical protein